MEEHEYARLLLLTVFAMKLQAEYTELDEYVRRMLEGGKWAARHRYKIQAMLWKNEWRVGILMEFCTFVEKEVDVLQSIVAGLDVGIRRLGKMISELRDVYERWNNLVDKVHEWAR